MRKDCPNRACLSKGSGRMLTLSLLSKEMVTSFKEKRKNSSSWHVGFTMINDVILAILQVYTRRVMQGVYGGSYVDG